MNRIFKWVAGLVILAVIFAQFGIEIGIIAGLVALAGGTIIGFAAMKTIGNAIAGIIVMTSRPFKIGDRIFFNGQFADVLAIDLIYTRMKTLDSVLVSVPKIRIDSSDCGSRIKARMLLLWFFMSSFKFIGVMFTTEVVFFAINNSLVDCEYTFFAAWNLCIA